MFYFKTHLLTIHKPLTWKVSQTPKSFMSTILPVSPSTPHVAPPVACFAVRVVMVRIVFTPQFWNTRRCFEMNVIVLIRKRGKELIRSWLFIISCALLSWLSLTCSFYATTKGDVRNSNINHAAVALVHGILIPSKSASGLLSCKPDCRTTYNGCHQRCCGRSKITS